MIPHTLPAANIPSGESLLKPSLRPAARPVGKFASLALLLIALGFLMLAGAAHAQYQWWGGDQNTPPQGYMTYNDNWDWGGGNPYNFGYGTDLEFVYNNSSESVITDNYSQYGSSWGNVNNIYFESSFSDSSGIAWNSTANGSTAATGFNFATKLENDSSGTVTINTPLSGGKNGASNIQLNAVNGNLILNGPLYNDSDYSYYAYGSSTTYGISTTALTINTNLVGNSGVSFTLGPGAGTGYGTVNFTAAQTWGSSTNGVNINVGELWISNGGSLDGGVAPVTVGLSDGNTAKLWLANLTGGQTFNDPITVNNQATAAEKVVGGLNTSGTSTFGGNISLNGQVNLSAATGGTVVFNGTFSGASQNVVVNGYQEPFSGIIVMGASNTYTGSTYISGGTLEINPGGSSNGSANFYLGEVSGVQTATLALGGTAGGQTLNNAITVRAGSTGAKTISSLATSSTSTLGGGITLDDNLTVTSASGGTLALTGNITSGASAALTGTFNNAGSVSISGTIGGGAGAIAVTQSGAGTTTLSAANTYAGATTVNAGTLMVTGSLNGTSGASVAAGATFEVDGLLNAGATTTVNGTLRGTGSVGAITANGGAIAAGLTVANSQTATPGTLTAAGAVNLSGSTTFSIRLGMVSGATGDNDQLAVNSGSISLNGANLQLNIGSFLDHSGNLGHTYVIINGGAGLTGLGGDIFAGLAEGAAINAGSGYQLTVDYASSASGGALGSGSDVVLQLGVVPEPGACGMVLGGAGVLLGFQGMRRRRAVRVS